VKFIKITIAVVAVFLLATVALLGTMSPAGLTAETMGVSLDPGSGIMPATLQVSAETATLAPDNPMLPAVALLVPLLGLIAYRYTTTVMRPKRKVKRKIAHKPTHGYFTNQLLRVRQLWDVGRQPNTA
jgi:hypothetical protein